MKRLNVALEDQNYRVLVKYRDEHKHRNFDEAINAMISSFVRPHEHTMPKVLSKGRETI
jgi:hypothetical protein